MNALQEHDAGLLVTHDWLIGIDEAGRGALAGPVVAGACVLTQEFFNSAEALTLSLAVNDSKQLSVGLRTSLFGLIELLQSKGLLDVAVATSSVEEIAEHNILGATRLAMQRAVENLAARTSRWRLPQTVMEDAPLFDNSTDVKIIVDGRPLKPFPYAHEGIIKGDGKSLCIAMASIAAKVARDKLLCEIAQDFPLYGFPVHKGYATKAHREAILSHGPSPVHRKRFLRNILFAASCHGET